MNLSIHALLAERSLEHKAHFDAYKKQRGFIEAHKYAPIAYLSAGNGCGKTAIGGFIDACHFTGEYPDDWEGPRFDKPGEFWVFSTSPKTLINGIQEQLFCPGGFHKIEAALYQREDPWPIELTRGGKLPKRMIHSISKAPNVPKGNDYVEYVTVNHVSGGKSTIWFGHYDLGPKKIAAKHNLKMVHFDEIPPFEMFSEAIARQRTTDSGVKMIITATPERKADQKTIAHIFDDDWEKSGNSRTIITIDDVPDNVISKKNKEDAKRLTPERDKAAKLYGLPVSGSVFFELSPDQFRLSMSEWINLKHSHTYSVIHGMDFGFNDDSALAALWTNTVDGTVVLEKSIKKRWMAPSEFYFAAKKAGFDLNLPVAWPHDGVRRDKDLTSTKQGKQGKKMQATFYREAGFEMMGTHTKRFLVEENKHAVFAEIENAAKQGMFYIVAGNSDFEEEWRGLQIGEDGKVKGPDHIIDAVTCAWLNRQYGRRPKQEQNSNVIGLRPMRQAQSLGISSHLLR